MDDGSTPADPSDDHWIECSKLTPPPGTQVSSFGLALSLDGDRVLIGAHGAAFEFQLIDGGTPSDPADDVWLTAATLVGLDSEADDLFGTAVSLRGEFAVACSLHAGGGASYLFRRTASGTGWEQVARLAQPTDGTHAFFGVSSVLTAEHLLVGEQGFFPALGAGGLFFGAVHPYALTSEPWSYLSTTSGGPPNAACLLGKGSTEPASPIAVVLQGQPPLAPGLLVVGTSSVYQPFKGGVLVPSPDRLVGLIQNQGEKLTWASSWPPGLPQGATFFVQAWFSTSGFGQSYVSTNGLAVTAH
jgi:hypothetical protein